MNTTQEVLLIIVGILLSVYLIINVILLVFAVKVVKSVQRIAAKGELVVENAEHAAEMFSRAARPAGLLRSIGDIVEAINKHKRRK
jgi:hypothetical protein